MCHAGCLPAEKFIPDLMTHLCGPHYVGLLTAAKYHGAGHQAPMVFQVIVPTSRRGLECGEVRVEFIARRDMSATLIVERNTHTGVLRIATPEATAIELVGYPEQCGYLNNVATVLAELADSINGERGNVVYRFESEDTPPLRMRLKVGINSREHFTEMGAVRLPYRIESRWFSGEAEVTTFDVNELLGTKLRALYQRKKGRDLFDLWLALDRGVVDPDALIKCFARHMAETGQTVTRAQFEANLCGKAGDRDFRGDIQPLLRPGVVWDFEGSLSCWCKPV